MDVVHLFHYSGGRGSVADYAGAVSSPAYGAVACFKKSLTPDPSGGG